ncbi:MAG: 23S rRNA (adenine(2030)-N(6))-methyltransferase RlmJ [Alphaproteobacteria bacterium]|nr:23S rRNA (adenine(2030)-N(6))-methyltransferase RlmJ [Alphaproteobacteria bacterium]
MNYRHAYHAGNFADVLKHVVLCLVVEHLKKKAKPFRAIDSHAGRGLYDLGGIEAGKTGEWREGIGRLLDRADAPAELAPYLDAVRVLGAPRTYPGSPALLRHLLRPIDRMVFAELHPEDGAALRDFCADDPRITLRIEDGYRALGKSLPPPERRGVILIDPPFEFRDEFDRLIMALKDAHRRFAGGIYLLWYPIKPGWSTEAFHGELSQAGIRDMVAVEQTVRAQDPAAPNRLLGSGLILVNPPFGLTRALDEIVLPYLGAALDAGARSHRVVVLAPE